MKKTICAIVAIVAIMMAAVVAVWNWLPTNVVETSTEVNVEANNEPEDVILLDGDGELMELTQIVGVITEIGDGYILIEAEQPSQVQVNMTEDTLVEGVDALAVGQTVMVQYDGKMTRSLPAQITALHIGVYELKGTVTAVQDGVATIVKAENGGEVLLTLPEQTEVAVGDTITAYTTGMMTMSIPPMMNALTVNK